MPGRFDKLNRGDRGLNRGDRFDKFTERARFVFSLAQGEAQRLHHNYIGTEHLLLGLVREGDGVAAKVLVNMGVQLNDVRREVEFIIGRGDRIVLGEIGLTPRAKKVMELAVDEARRLNHHYIGTEHLLLGLIREEEGIAARVLEQLGVNLDAARQNVLIMLNEGPGTRGDDAAASNEAEFGGLGAASTGPKANVVTCRIDDRDLDALDALVEAGIRSTRSDAASWLIHAGIETHSDLFNKVYATVEQIRQLRSEAKRMAQGPSEEAGEQESPPAQPDEPPAEQTGNE
jgi:ATP-dependent Clp protease ATP-binding subunit ClpA